MSSPPTENLVQHTVNKMIKLLNRQYLEVEVHLKLLISQIKPDNLLKEVSTRNHCVSRPALNPLCYCEIIRSSSNCIGMVQPTTVAILQLNLIALRKSKIAYKFGLSESNRIKQAPVTINPLFQGHPYILTYILKILPNLSEF